MQIFEDYGDKRQYFDSLGGLALGKRAEPHVRLSATAVVLQGYSGHTELLCGTTVLDRTLVTSISLFGDPEWTVYTF